MARSKQTTLEGKVNHHVSFGSADTELEEELRHKQEVFGIFRGHIKTVDSPSGGKPGLNVTVVPVVDFISKDAYVAAMGHDWEDPK
jgi:hypothetical protein